MYIHTFISMTEMIRSQFTCEHNFYSTIFIFFFVLLTGVHRQRVIVVCVCLSVCYHLISGTTCTRFHCILIISAGEYLHEWYEIQALFSKTTLLKRYNHGNIKNCWKLPFSIQSYPQDRGDHSCYVCLNLHTHL